MHINTQSSTISNRYQFNNEDIGVSQKEVTELIFDLSSQDVNNRALTHPELQDFYNSLGSADISAHTQSLLIDLIRILAEARKKSRELSQTQSTVSFKIAQNAYSHTKSQAQAQMTAGIVTAGAGVVQAAIELGASAAMAGYGSKKEAEIVNDVKSRGLASDSVASTGANATDIDTSAPPAYKEFADTDISGAPLKSIDADGNIEPMPTSAKKSADGADADATDTKAADKSDKLTDAQQKEVNDRITTMYKKLDAYRQIGMTVGSIMGNLMKVVASTYEAKATQEQAEAALEKAFEEVYRNQSQHSQEFAQELKELMNGVLDLLRSIEQSRNKAFSGVIQAV